MTLDVKEITIKLELQKLQKMVLIYNALEDDWKIHKKNNSYVFKKKHDNDSKFLTDDYLEAFLKQYLDNDNITSA